MENSRREEQLGELRSMARHKRGLTHWRGERGRSRLVNSKAWHVTNEDSLAGGEEEGGPGWCALKRGPSQMRTQPLEGVTKAEEARYVTTPQSHPTRTRNSSVVMVRS